MAYHRCIKVSWFPISFHSETIDWYIHANSNSIHSIYQSVFQHCFDFPKWFQVNFKIVALTIILFHVARGNQIYQLMPFFVAINQLPMLHLRCAYIGMVHESKWNLILWMKRKQNRSTYRTVYLFDQSFSSKNTQSCLSVRRFCWYRSTPVLYFIKVSEIDESLKIALYSHEKPTTLLVY